MKDKMSLFQAPRLSRSARLSPVHPYYLRAWNRLKNAASIFSLKKIHPQGTRDSAEGIRTNYRWARVKKQTERLFPRHLIQPKQVQEHLILQLLFDTGIFLANELRATPLSISCVLKRRFFVINRLFYDACSAEKSKDLICPQESIPFDSIGFYNTFCFSSLRKSRFCTRGDG